MLCRQCRAIHFRLGRPTRPNHLYYVLHRSRQSFDRSLSECCSLCLLINGKLDGGESQNEICQIFDAYVVLVRFYKPSKVTIAVPLLDFSFVTVVSRLGTAVFDVIEPLPAKYSSLDSPKLSPSRTASGTLRDRDNPEKKRRKVVEESSAHESTSTPQQTSSHDSSTGSAVNLQLARGWITNCLEHHSQCEVKALPGTRTPLPARLVNVEDPDGLVLEETNSATRGPYVALSYAWGQGKRVQTLKSNYTTHQRLLPAQTLPQTIADAVRVTRMLSYKYLWVDAFCIIQDDNDDLEKELPNMGNIYRYAEFTIYAQGGQSSHSGLFVDRDPRLFHPCKFSVSTTIDDGPTTTEDITIATTCNSPDYLENRGWVLQERVLSNRCLMFGQQIAWACTTHEAKETRPVLQLSKAPLKGDFRSTTKQLRGLLYQPPQLLDPSSSLAHRASCFDVWYATVEKYSDQELTHVADNLKALSGLAALFNNVQGTTYAAGLWKDDLTHGLAWYVGLNDERSVTKETVGPSWSWPSVGKVRVRFRSWRGVVDSVSDMEAKMISVSIKLESEMNSYGTVSEGLLTISGLLRKAILQYAPSYAAERVERSYGGRKNSFEPGDVRENPRYPAILLDTETKLPVAEAALDRPPSSQSGFTRGFLGSVASPDLALQVWCVLLHVQRFRDGCRSTVLILNKHGKDRGVFVRLGLGFFGDDKDGFFGINEHGGLTKKGTRETVQIL